MMRKVQQQAKQVITGLKSPAGDHLGGRLDRSEKMVVDPHCTFYFQMNGSEMAGHGIYDRSLLVVDRSLNAINDTIVVADLNGELVCRLYKEDTVGVYLVSDQETLTLGEGHVLQVWGVVTAACKATLPKGLQNREV